MKTSCDHFTRLIDAIQDPPQANGKGYPTVAIVFKPNSPTNWIAPGLTAYEPGKWWTI